MYASLIAAYRSFGDDHVVVDCAGGDGPESHRDGADRFIELRVVQCLLRGAYDVESLDSHFRRSAHVLEHLVDVVLRQPRLPWAACYCRRSAK